MTPRIRRSKNIGDLYIIKIYKFKPNSNSHNTTKWSYTYI